ncbi:MAG: hypothetical protein ACYTG5_10525 [Planctomycetota bacterium]|jgi:hypothetical protein
MKIRKLAVDLFQSPCITRLPFRFGATVMREAPSLVARVRAQDESGRQACGYSADLLVPKWFRKNPTRTSDQDAAELIASAQHAATLYGTASEVAQSPFRIWWSVYQSSSESCGDDPDDQLVRGFGIALIERAMLDAACRFEGVSFFQALSRDLFEFDPGEVHGELAEWQLSASLSTEPLRSVRVRHTVGLADSLRAAEITPDNRCPDGLPQALEEDLDFYGIDLLKVKIGLGFEADRRRLMDLAELFAERDQPIQWTADGNEQFEDLEELIDLFVSLGDSPRGARFLQDLMYIEQPLHRRANFAADPQQNPSRGRSTWDTGVSR